MQILGPWRFERCSGHTLTGREILNKFMLALCAVGLLIVLTPVYDQLVPIHPHGDDVEVSVDCNGTTYASEVKEKHTYLPLTRCGYYADMYRYCQPDDCIRSFVSTVKEQSGLEGAKLAEELMEVCHSLKYVLDSDAHGKEDWWQLPCETLMLGTGDCEDFALLYIAMCKAAGFDCVIVKEPGHISAGVKVDGGLFRLDYNGESYLAVDPTAGMFGNRMPDVMFIMDDGWQLRHTVFFAAIGVAVLFFIYIMRTL